MRLPAEVLGTLCVLPAPILFFGFFFWPDKFLLLLNAMSVPGVGYGDFETEKAILSPTCA